MPSLALPRLALAALALSASTAVAQIAPGSTLVVTGAADATDIGSPGVVLDFSPYSVTGTWSGVSGFGGAAARDVSGSLARITVGVGPQAVSQFLTIGGYTFDLAGLPSGPYAQANCRVTPEIGQTCTPLQSPGTAISPFYMVNEASGDPDYPINAYVAFNLIGTVSDPYGHVSAFTGVISSTFEGLAYQEVLGALEGQGPAGLPDVPFTGTFVAGAVLPEPGTYALVGAGLLGLAGVARTRRRS
ncbi:hypothetical protein tb265_00030 [Gemmatimonadetes bacterium T265]|nr:hypothetical protein tb265_00030 [Gemmatimonadetes bacterium T265]